MSGMDPNRMGPKSEVRRKGPNEGTKRNPVPVGATALADVIKNNGAMTSLDLSNNKLRPEGAKHIAAVIPKCK